MRNLWAYISSRTNLADWLIIVAIVLVYLLLRGITYTIGLPPMEWVALGGMLVLFVVIRSITTPFILLIFITTGSLLGNLILVFEDGLIPFSLFQIFYIFSVLVFIARWFISGFEPIRKSGFELELVLFFSLIFLSIIWTPDAELGFLHALRVFALAGLLYLFINWIQEPRQITLLIISLIAIGSIMGLVAIYDAIANPMAIIQDVLSDGTRLASRARIGQVDPNIFASLFFLPLSFTACITFSNTKWRYRLLGSVFFLILLAAVLITFSRSSWVAVIVMLFVLAFMYRQYNLFLITALAGVILIVSIPELRHLFLNILDRFVAIFSGSADASSWMRVVLLEGSIRIFFDSWLMGVGWRGFPDAFIGYYSLQETLGIYEPHNVIYLVYSELGIIGFLLFIFIVYKIFYLAWQNIRLSANHGVEIKALSHAVFGTFLAYAVFYQFIGSGFTDNQLWITTGIIIALNYYLKNQTDTAETSLSGQEGYTDT